MKRMKKRKVFINEYRLSLIRYFEQLKEHWGDSKPPKIYPDQSK